MQPADRRGPRLRGRRRRLLRRPLATRRTARCPASGWTTCAPAETPRPTSAKRDPRDFALWKGAKPGEPVLGDAVGPGPARLAPGVLGDGHQVPGRRRSTSTAAASTWSSRTTRTSSPSPRAAGDGFARYWLHNGLVGVAGEKMSKSLGNSLLVDAMVTQVRPVELRYYLGQAHYRSGIEYSAGGAGRGGRRLPPDRGLRHPGGGDQPAGRRPGRRPGLPASFAAALDDDLAVPQALAVVHDTVRDGNNALAAGDTAAALGRAGATSGPCSAVLGLDPLSEPWASAGPGDDLHAVVDALVTVALDAAAGRPRAQGLRGRRRDPGRPAGGRHPRRGHPAGTALGAEAVSGGAEADRPGPGGAGGPSPASRGPAPAATASGSSRARARPRPPQLRPGHPAQRRAAAKAAGARPRRAVPRGSRPDRARIVTRPERRRGPTGPCRDRGGRVPDRGSRAADRARGAGDAPEVVAGRNAVLESLRARVPATALLRRAPGLDSDQRINEAIRLAADTGHPGGRGGPRRTGPADRRRGAPGPRPAGPPLRLRPPRRPAAACPGPRRATADRGARRRLPTRATSARSSARRGVRRPRRARAGAGAART